MRWIHVLFVAVAVSCARSDSSSDGVKNVGRDEVRSSLARQVGWGEGTSTGDRPDLLFLDLARGHDDRAASVDLFWQVKQIDWSLMRGPARGIQGLTGDQFQEMRGFMSYVGSDVRKRLEADVQNGAVAPWLECTELAEYWCRSWGVAECVIGLEVLYLAKERSGVEYDPDVLVLERGRRSMLALLVLVLALEDSDTGRMFPEGSPALDRVVKAIQSAGSLQEMFSELVNIADGIHDDEATAQACNTLVYACSTLIEFCERTWGDY